MISKEKIERINELARKKKNEGLNPDEQAEQKQLYQEYLLAVRGQVREQLEAAGIPKKGEQGHVCSDGCGHHDHQHGPGCGCDHKH